VADEVVLPQWGMNMLEGTLVRWLKAVGETVEIGEPVAEIETEKIESELESPVAGVVLQLFIKEGETIPVNTPLVLVGELGEEAGVMADHESAVTPAGTEGRGSFPVTQGTVQAEPSARRLARDRGVSLEEVRGSGPGGRILVADVQAHLDGLGGGADAAEVEEVQVVPAARRLAREKGINLISVSGSGPGGRILLQDVEAVAFQRPAGGTTGPKVSPTVARLAADRGVDVASVSGSGPGGRVVRKDVELALRTSAVEEMPYEGVRRTVGDRMLASLHDSAQFTLTMEVDVTESTRLRRDLVGRPEGGAPTYTDIVIRSVALALREHPRLNSTLNGSVIRKAPEINVGFAVALDEGVIVPVIRKTDEKSLSQISSETRELAERARSGGLRREDVTEGTFTVTSLGMYGIDSFTPVINPPQAAILGIGRVSERPSFTGDSGTDVERRSLMSLSLTIDHRIVDGAPGARFLGAVAELLEHPNRLLTAAWLAGSNGAPQ